MNGSQSQENRDREQVLDEPEVEEKTGSDGDDQEEDVIFIEELKSKIGEEITEEGKSDEEEIVFMGESKLDPDSSEETGNNDEEETGNEEGEGETEDDDDDDYEDETGNNEDETGNNEDEEELKFFRELKSEPELCEETGNSDDDEEETGNDDDEEEIIFVSESKPLPEVVGETGNDDDDDEGEIILIGTFKPETEGTPPRSPPVSPPMSPPASQPRSPPGFAQPLLQQKGKAQHPAPSEGARPTSQQQQLGDDIQETKTGSVFSCNSRFPWCFGHLFECLICKQQFFEEKSLKCHLTRTHKTMVTFNLTPISENRFQCFQCGLYLLHQRTPIRRHAEAHGLSLDSFFTKFQIEIESSKIYLPITDQSLFLRAGQSALNRKRKSVEINDLVKNHFKPIVKPM